MSPLSLHMKPMKHKVIGFLTFKTRSPIHVGAGGAEARRSFLRLLSGKLLIPSTSWKGAFRSISEKIAKAAKYEGIEGLAVKLYKEISGGISYRSGESFKEFAEEFIKRLKGGESRWVKESPEGLEKILKDIGYSPEEIKNVKEGRDRETSFEMAELYLALYCPIGKLYGNKAIAGKLRFGDTILDAKAAPIRPGVGINRKAMTARSGILYFTETLTSSGLKLFLLLDNPIPGQSDSTLLAETINYIRELGLEIGGRKSVGLGKLEIEEDRGEFYLIKLEKGKESTLGNPFKKAEKLNLNEFINWLKGKA